MFALLIRPGNSVGDLAIDVLAIGGIIAIVYVILTQCFGIQIPPWLKTCLWIFLAVMIGIVLIRFIQSM